MPDGSPLQPELFQFTSEELSMAPHIVDILTPPHVKQLRLQQQQQQQQTAPAIAVAAPTTSVAPGLAAAMSSSVPVNTSSVGASGITDSMDAAGGSAAAHDKLV